MSKKKPVKDDVAQKEFFRSHVHFADVCNGTLYNGEQRIRESDLEELDSDISGTIQGKHGKESLERK